MDKSSKAYQKDIQDIIQLLEIQHAELLHNAKQARMGGDNLLEEAAMATKVSGLMKDLQSLTYGTAKDRALSQLDKNQIAVINGLTRPLPNGCDINLKNPTDEQLDLPAIIHNLGNLTRFGGAAQQIHNAPYTVAFHILLGSYIIQQCVQFDYGMDDVSIKEFNNNELIKYWLAHDLQEGSLGFDMPTPYKNWIKHLAGWDIFKYIEDGHAEPIHKLLGLEWPVPKQIEGRVKSIDEMCLKTEAIYLLNIDASKWPGQNDPITAGEFKAFMDGFYRPHARQASKLLVQEMKQFFPNFRWPEGEFYGKNYGGDGLYKTTESEAANA